MKLSEAKINEFVILYEAEFEETIDFADAELMANEVLSLYEAIWMHEIKRHSSKRGQSDYTDQLTT